MGVAWVPYTVASGAIDLRRLACLRARCHRRPQVIIHLAMGESPLFIAMNRFRVNPERVEEFEQIWLERETHLQGLPGFVEFHMLRGPEKEDHVLYASHTVWRSREDFEAWTHSEAFRAAHANAGQSRREGLYLGPPTFEGFEVIQTIGNESDA